MYSCYHCIAGYQLILKFYLPINQKSLDTYIFISPPLPQHTNPETERRQLSPKGALFTEGVEHIQKNTRLNLIKLTFILGKYGQIQGISYCSTYFLKM